MVVLSRFPIVDDGVRTFRNLLWTSMPGARLPDDPTTPEPADFYSPEELAVLRLSSTSHWDVPVYVGGRIVHVLAAHPAAPGGDGPEDRNGLRNADEIRFWADYVNGPDAAWIVDDAGVSGGLTAGSDFVIVGDMNSDPVDGDSVAGAIDQLLTIPGIQDPAPRARERSKPPSARDGERDARRRPGAGYRRPRRRPWATYVSTTPCLRTGSRSSPPASSGRAATTTCRAWSRSTRWRVRTTASCGSTSSDRRSNRAPRLWVLPKGYWIGECGRGWRANRDR